MLKFVSVASAASFLLATAAFAQAAPDTASWTGPYAGIHGGYGFDNDRLTRNAGVTDNNLFAIANGIRPDRLQVNRAGFLGGGQLGYNLDLGRFVVGGEADFSYMDSKGSKTYRSPQAVATFPAGRRLYVRDRLDFLGTVRARAGYKFGDGIVYATGGYAYGRVKGSAEFDGDTDAQINYFGRHNYLAQGWTAGGGLEFRPWAGRGGAMSRVSLRLETLYYDLGKSHIYALQTSTQPGFYRLTTTTRGYNGRVGLNYAF